MPDRHQVEYDRTEGVSTQPERISFTIPKVGQADRKAREADGTEYELPQRTHHVLTNAEGNTPVDLNEWERKVLDSEAAQPGFKAWCRNPARVTKESLAIAYKYGTGGWKALRPDFIFFSSQPDGTIVVGLVDSHDHHLSDALPKLRGLADLCRRVRFRVPTHRVRSRGRWPVAGVGSH